MAVTANHVSRDGTKWTFEEHKADGHGEASIVYLSPAMQELTRKLITLYPDGPLFRSTRRFGGVRRPWTASASAAASSACASRWSGCGPPRRTRRSDS
jgi:hypothetical protein